MTNSDPFGFRPHWDAILDIYRKFAEICDRHGFRYWVMEGNAIGALRHNGFVPWDDDLDVAMPRPDYEKFIAVANKELPSNLRFWDWRDLDDWRFTFGKIQEVEEDSVLKVEKEVGHKLSNGIYIDILIVDGLPTGKWSRMIYEFKMLALGSVVRRRLTSFGCQTRAGRCSWLLGMICSWFISGRKIVLPVMKKIDALMKSCPFEDSKYTWRAGAAIRVTMEFPREIWNGAVWHEFEGLRVPLPAGYDQYLRIQYGDYMKLPPQEKQQPSHSLPYRFPWWLGPTRMPDEAHRVTE